MDPFTVLDLPLNCTDEEVRSRYHLLLRKYTPEQCPEQFQQIHQAYQALATAAKRAEAFINPVSGGHLIDFAQAYAHLPGRAKPPGLDALKSLLRACAAAQRKLSQ